jgi:hypothetical protein
LNGTKHRFSGFSQPRQCGEEVLRMLVTGGPPGFGRRHAPAHQHHVARVAGPQSVRENLNEPPPLLSSR